MLQYQPKKVLTLEGAVSALTGVAVDGREVRVTKIFDGFTLSSDHII